MRRPEASTSGALQTADKAVQAGAGSGVAHEARGLALWSLGRMEEAAAEYRKAMELDPKLGLPDTLNRTEGRLSMLRNDQAVHKDLYDALDYGSEFKSNAYLQALASSIAEYEGRLKFLQEFDPKLLNGQQPQGWIYKLQAFPQKKERVLSYKDNVTPEELDNLKSAIDFHSGEDFRDVVFNDFLKPKLNPREQEHRDQLLSFLDPSERAKYEMPTGEAVANAVHRGFQALMGPRHYKKVSQDVLKDAGYDAIKYPANWFSGGSDKSNYVVFDPKQIEILEKKKVK